MFSKSAYNHVCMAKMKDPAAVSLGRKGGLKKVPKGLATMTPEKRAAVRKKALETRLLHARVAKKQVVEKKLKT